MSKHRGFIGIVLLSLLVTACGPAASTGQQSVQKSGYDRRGRPVPRYILEDRRIADDPRYWDTNGDFVLDFDDWQNGSFDPGDDGAVSDYEQRRFIDYIQSCNGCVEKARAKPVTVRSKATAPSIVGAQ